MNNWINGQFEYLDLFLAPLYIFIIVFIFNAFSPKEKVIKKYFIRGLSYKILGGIIFWFVYCWLYNGGDSWAYFYSAKAIGNLLVQDFDKGYMVISAKTQGSDIFTYFNSNTGFPASYMSKDFHTFSVCRYTSILTIICFKSFLVTTILIASLSFIGMWKFFTLITKLYPNITRPVFYLVIALPSLTFWGSGIMKDTFVLSAGCWFTYNFYMVFIKRKKLVTNSLLGFINIIIIINIKSYLIISLIPGALLWLNSAYLRNINNILLKLVSFPIIASVIIFIGIYSFQNLSGLMGKYGNVDSAIKQAKVIQEDLLREENYGNNNYYLGDIDGSVSGMLKLAPMAVFTAVFRPLPWEIGSPTMVISAIENTLLLILTIILIIRISPITFIRVIFSEPFLVMAFTFSILFAYGVGVASTNFGALVRYKIPLMPFFFTGIYIIFNLTRKKSKNSQNDNLI